MLCRPSCGCSQRVPTQPSVARFGKITSLGSPAERFAGGGRFVVAGSAGGVQCLGVAVDARNAVEKTSRTDHESAVPGSRVCQHHGALRVPVVDRNLSASDRGGGRDMVLCVPGTAPRGMTTESCRSRLRGPCRDAGAERAVDTHRKHSVRRPQLKVAADLRRHGVDTAASPRAPTAAGSTNEPPSGSPPVTVPRHADGLAR